jgi:pimeloyl-ACP methyl ester carboxylesterase
MDTVIVQCHHSICMPEEAVDDGDRWHALRRDLYKLPQNPVPRAHPRNWIFRMKRASDFIGHSNPKLAMLLRKINPYPQPWKYVRLQTEDNVQVAAWYGPSKRKDPPFGIVIVPGMFATKDDTIHKRRAIHMWRHWDIPVMCIDLRAFGESTGIATAGWKEAYDVLAAVKYLAETSGVKKVGTIAESMGGAAALNAAAHDAASGSELMLGGVLAWSAFVDAKDAVEYISTKPPKNHPFNAKFKGFSRMLMSRSHGHYRTFKEFMEDSVVVNGLTSLDELWELANPKWKLGLIHAPVLEIHAVDDPIVPVRHARRMERYARDHPHIQVVVTNWGEHTGYEAMDPWWYWEVVSRFFGEVNGLALPNLYNSKDSVPSTRPPPSEPSPEP